MLLLSELIFKCPSIIFLGFFNLRCWTCGYELPLLILLREIVLFPLKWFWVPGQEPKIDWLLSVFFSRLSFLIVNPEMKTLVFSFCIVKAKLTMSVAIFSEILPLFRSFVSWCKITVSGDTSFYMMYHTICWSARNRSSWNVRLHLFVQTSAFDML